LPQPPDDLKATRKGDKVTLTWTVPTQTSDRALVKHAGVTRICRAPQPAMSECTQAVGELAAAQLQPGKPATYTDALSPQQMTGGEATYAIEAQNDRRRSAGLSNQVQVPLAPTLPAPNDVRAEVTANGPALTWSANVDQSAPAGLSYLYRVSRSLEGADKFSAIGDVPSAAPGFTDPAFEWEKHYVYRVTPITAVKQAGGTVEIEGDDSAPVAVFTHDTFPPAVPSGVQAVYSGLAQQKFIDLTWAPDTDADLAGYNVYRREEGGAPVKISSEPAKTPAFRDPNVQPGRHYLYGVSAVDVRGNESTRSAEAAESVPQ
jgi:hypothetical protein